MRGPPDPPRLTTLWFLDSKVIFALFISQFNTPEVQMYSFPLLEEKTAEDLSLNTCAVPAHEKHSLFLEGRSSLVRFTDVVHSLADR